MFNWYDYIDPAVIDMFEEETGATVEYVNFTTNEEMYTKLEAGAANYDVIFPSDYMIERMIANDMLEELDTENMPNLSGLIEWLKTTDYDPGGQVLRAVHVGHAGHPVQHRDGRRRGHQLGRAVQR